MAVTSPGRDKSTKPRVGWLSLNTIQRPYPAHIVYTLFLLLCFCYLDLVCFTPLVIPSRRCNMTSDHLALLHKLNIRMFVVISTYLDCHSICPSVCHLLAFSDANQRGRTELSSIFSRFGTVNHCVILATVDNASRRRGFVVMSTHAEAKVAMDNISQTNIR